MKEKNMNKKGFNLLELLFVMVIISVLGVIVYYGAMSYLQKAKKNTFLTEFKTVYNESNKLYSKESLFNNKLDVISTDDGCKNLDLSNKDLKYCVNLDENGKINHLKVTNGMHFIEGDSLDDAKIENIKYGSFKKFDCKYELDQKDLLEEPNFKLDFKENSFKYLKIFGIVFVVAVVFGIIFGKK